MLQTALTILSTPVHPVLFPYVWGTTLHAARISLLFNTLSRSSHLTIGANLSGFLLTCWGGSLASHLLLGLYPPQLYLLGPWINYSAVHLVASFLLSSVSIPDLARTNAYLFPLDGLLRANAVLHTLSLLDVPTVNPVLVASPLFHFILGAAVSSGGGLVGGTFSLWTPNWHFSTPPPLRAGQWGIWGTLDIWAGGVVTLVYDALTAHPACAGILSIEPVSVPTARSLAATLMIVLFGLRVLASPRPRPQSKAEEEKKAQ
uniref:Peptidase S54 rhomboid domain-containing protein n=1 Tax=Mycena chlorophos TaxID=658473 RepID=A0ABQ0M471_MYCCL|nr:predicted protein [Mycena chlorophos]